eukprot:6405838-Pyramimonas_sp.AAC.1
MGVAEGLQDGQREPGELSDKPRGARPLPWGCPERRRQRRPSLVGVPAPEKGCPRRAQEGPGRAPMGVRECFQDDPRKQRKP